MPIVPDVAYTCPSCFEENAVGIDPTGGRRQRFVEDCPVCCRPLLFVAEIDRDGDPVIVSVERE
ncbi:MAG: CPXCG motif-containing cysteine-rich protein [Candidatus Velthaea sp.]|jgi:hypothetical protein